MKLRTHDKLNILFGRQGSSRICNPYESFEFLNHMKNTGSQTCDDCLPDCETTIYKTHITTSSYRRCCPLLFKLVLYYPAAYFFLLNIEGVTTRILGWVTSAHLKIGKSILQYGAMMLGKRKERMKRNYPSTSRRNLCQTSGNLNCFSLTCFRLIFFVQKGSGTTNLTSKHKFSKRKTKRQMRTLTMHMQRTLQLPTIILKAQLVWNSPEMPWQLQLISSQMLGAFLVCVWESAAYQ